MHMVKKLESRSKNVVFLFIIPPRFMLACQHLYVPHTHTPHAAPEKLDELMPEFVRDNAGKAFEFMVEKVDEDRKAAGLGTVAEMFAGETPRVDFWGRMEPPPT